MANETKPARFRESIPFFPYHVLTEAVVAYGMLALLVVLASLLPGGPQPLDVKADPLTTPEHIKPEWYFMSLYQVLKLVPRVIGVTVPIILGLLLFALPFVDHNPSRKLSDRRLGLGITAIVLLGLIVLSIWGFSS